MKRMTAKETLAESFRELAVSKNINKITVKDIAGNCGYSVATFYRHFKDKYDLVAWAYKSDVEELMKRVEFNETSWKQALTDAAAYYQKHREYLSNLLLHTNGYMSFLRNMTETNYTSLKRKLQSGANEPNIDAKTDMYIRLYCYGTVALTCDWLLGRLDADAETLAETYNNALPQQLRPYLFDRKKP